MFHCCLLCVNAVLAAGLKYQVQVTPGCCFTVVVSNTQVCRDPREREASMGPRDLQDPQGLQGFQDIRVKLEHTDYLVTAVACFGHICITHNTQQRKPMICNANADTHTHIYSNMLLHLFVLCEEQNVFTCKCSLIHCLMFFKSINQCNGRLLTSLLFSCRS